MGSDDFRRWRTRAWETVDTLSEPTLVALSAVGTLYLLAFGFEPLRRLFGLEDEPPTSAAVALAAVVAQLILVFTYRLRRELRAYRIRLDEVNAPPVFQMAAQVVDDIWRTAAADRRRRSHKLEVLALNGVRSWGLIHDKLIGPDSQKWEIRLYCVDPTARDSSLNFRPAWQFDDARPTIASIRSFRRSNDGRSKVTVKTYTSLPPVHGFRLNEGDIYISYAVWPGKNKPDVLPYTFWERVRGSDNTVRAVEYRRLFESWLRHVEEEAKVVGDGSVGDG